EPQQQQAQLRVPAHQRYVRIVVSDIFRIYLYVFIATTTTYANSCAYRWNQTGTTVAGTGTFGVGANQLYSPVSVFIDANDLMYIADTNNNRIQRWLLNATSGTTSAGSSSGTGGSSASLLNTPNAVYVDSNQNLYIADSSNYRVQYWQSGASSGSTIAGLTGNYGSANTQLGSASY
ncbi:unnamed protein product, partial [Didymodactylos carnosus]